MDPQECRSTSYQRPASRTASRQPALLQALARPRRRLCSLSRMDVARSVLSRRGSLLSKPGKDAILMTIAAADHFQPATGSLCGACLVCRCAVAGEPVFSRHRWLAHPTSVKARSVGADHADLPRDHSSCNNRSAARSPEIIIEAPKAPGHSPPVQAESAGASSPSSTWARKSRQSKIRTTPHA